jgi:hypothetical protein
VEDVVAGRSGSKATKQPAVAVTITVFVSDANEDVAVAPLDVVADSVWVVNGLITLLVPDIFIMSCPL